MEYFLTSRRLGFRPWTSDDLPLALQLWGDPEVSAWIGGPFTADAMRTRLEAEIRQASECGLQYWPVFLLENDQHVGCAGVRPKREKVLELGYHLRPIFWRQGLASEAAQAVIEYAFTELGVDALFAGHHPSNLVSRRILENLHFAYAGDEFYVPSGLIEPTYLLPLARWRSRQS